MDITEERYELAAAAMKPRYLAGVSSKATLPVEESTEQIMVRIRIMAAMGKALRAYLMAVGAITTIVVVAVWLFSALAARGWTHDALPTANQPLGWAYDTACCSAMDCFELADDAVEETAAGFVIRRTGEVIPIGDGRLKRSKDEFYHQCTPLGDPNAKHSICLYVPDRGI